jgi:hypothetical protein
MTKDVGHRKASGRLAAAIVGILVALALLAVYAFQSGYRVGSDMAARDNAKAEARR